MCAKYGEEVFPEGSGKTKKAAKEAAAHVALQELRRGDFREQVRDALKTQMFSDDRGSSRKMETAVELRISV